MKRPVIAFIAIALLLFIIAVVVFGYNKIDNANTSCLKGKSCAIKQLQNEKE